jgi:deazaflavin-dependent oxidoreductase (nitroreductase family)
MSLESDYVPSPKGCVRTDVERIQEAGDTGVVHRQGRPVVLVTMRGAKSGALRKVPLMRVEHEGDLLIVASLGGAPEHPKWYWNLRANPDIEVQDGTQTFAARARELDGKERFDWWVRAVEAFPPYAEYQVRTQRLIPLFLLERR